MLPELEIPSEEAPAVAGEGEISLDLPALDMGSMEPSAEVDLAAEVTAEAQLELPESVFESVAPIAETAAVADTELDVPEISFDLSEPTPVETAVGAEALDTVELELPSLEMEPVQADDMDKTMVFQAPVAEAEEIVFESTPGEEAALDFNFDTEFAGPAETATETPVDATGAGLPDLDLSGISLELDDSPVEGAPAANETVGLELPAVEDIVLDTTATEVPAQADAAALDASIEAEAVEEITLSGSESADVDTKLDLVAAYMDMGDTEGARELLEEVLREGGPQQRERAQGLLDSLG